MIRVHGLDQEVAAAHGRVEHLEIEEPLDQVFVGMVGLLDRRNGGASPCPSR